MIANASQDVVERHTVSLKKSILPAAALLLFLLPLVSIRPPFAYTADLRTWQSDWVQVSNCLARHQLPCSHVDKYAPAYLVVSFLFQKLARTGLSANRVLEIWNCALLMLPPLCMFVFRGYRYGVRASIAYVTALLFTPVPPFYLFSLELQSGVWIGLFLSALLWYMEDAQPGALFLLLISAFFFPLYKDTQAPLVISALAVAAVAIGLTNRSRMERILSNRKAIWASASVVLGVTAATFVNLGYNYFRYQTILPKQYLAVAASTSPTLVKSLEFFAASVVSPNGGIVIFWFAGFLVAHFQLSHFHYTFRRVALVLSLVLGLISLIGFSLWWAPFGWDSWGNRLMVSPMLALLIVLIGTASPTHKQLRASMTAARILSLFIFALSTYFVFVSYYSNRPKIYSHALFSGPECTAMMAVLNNPANRFTLGFWRSDTYYACARERFLYFPVVIR